MPTETTLPLKSSKLGALSITFSKTSSNRAIAGQTAPGDGICIKNYQVNFDTHDVIFRYLRFRPGDEKGKEQDGFGGNGDHIVVDHCTASWGIDETLSINKASNLSVQWCLVSESLTKSLHKKRSHGYGGLWGGPGGSYHHNILAHHSSRNPRARQRRFRLARLPEQYGLQLGIQQRLRRRIVAAQLD